jgi:CRP/FNR family transcriptional regulator, cyclic AMP receptor protein
MAPGRIALLQAMPIFGALRDDALDLLLDGAQCMYVIEQGAVEVRKRWDGHDQTLHRLHVGDCFGEMALMDFFPRRCVGAG